MLKIILIIISFCFSSMLSADVLSIKKDAPKSYIVKKGDTLWDISGVFLEESWLWPKLWRLNPDISNPHLIYPGDVLHLVFDENGQPMLVRDKPVLSWSPKVRTKLKDQNPISTIPLNVIAPFLKYDTLLSPEKIDDYPVVLGNEDGTRSALEGTNVYVDTDLLHATSYGVYYKGDKIEDPETGELIGYYAVLVGTGKTSHVGSMANNEPSTLYIEDVKQEIRAGAIVLPVNEGQLYPSYFTMQSVDENINASILQSINGVREFGKFDILLVNKGTDDDVNPGDVFTIKHTGPTIINSRKGPEYKSEASRLTRLFSKEESAYNLPKKTIGKAMAFKVYEDVSLVLILSTQQSVRMKDVLTAP